MFASLRVSCGLRGAAAVLGMLIVFSVAARASVVAEFNYHTSEDASFTTGGLTGNFNLAGASTPPGAVTNSGMAVGIGVQSPARTGFLDLTDSNDGVQSTESYRQYFGTGPAAVGQSPNTFNFAAKTFVAIMKPGYSGAQAARRWYFHNGSTSVTGEYFLTSGDSGGRAAVAGGRGGENDFLLLTSNPVSWNTNTWYMVAYSLQPSSAEDLTPGSETVFGKVGLPDGKIRIYIRELKVGGTMTPGSVAITASTDTLRIWNDRQVVNVNNPFPPNFNSQFLAFGNRNDGNTIGNEGADHDFALIQLYSNFSDFSDFDAIFQSIIPEPSSAAMVLIGGLMLLARRRQARYEA